MPEPTKASQKSANKMRTRLPRLPGGFSVNFCRNPLCDLYGVLPDPRDGRGRPANPGSNLARGKVSGSGGERTYVCPSCGRSSILKSNKALAEEYARLSRLNRRTKRESCPSVACINHGATVGLMPSRYRKFGKTAKGDPRYQCKACKKTFSIGRSTRRHKRSDLNGKVFRSLVNGVTLSAISRVLDTSLPEVYSKIDFIHEQCQVSDISTFGPD